MESFDRGVITSQTFRPHRSVERGKNTILLHDLVLGDTASRLGTLHGVYGASACIHVLDKSDAERTATVLITGELGNRSFCCLCVVKLDDTRAARATIGLVLNLRTINLSNSREQIDQIFVAGRPGQL